MSDYTLKYRISFINDQRNSDLSVNGQLIYIDISPVSSFGTGDITVIDLKGEVTAFVTKTINNDRDKFQPIKSTQAQLRFVSDPNSDITLFAESGDNDWFVKAYRSDGAEIFLGFMVLDNMSQPFQPVPQVINLVASDHLGILKEIPLVDYLDENPSGYNQVGKFIAWCLRKTGLELDIYAVMNIQHGFGSVAVDLANFSTIAGGTIFFPSSFYTQFYEGSTFLCTCTGANNGTTFTVITNNSGASLQVSPSPVNQSGVTDAVFTDVTSGHLFDKIYLWSKTFESKINISISCYEALEAILGEDSELFQQWGAWWILRPDELEGNLIYVAIFNSEGEFQSFQSGATYNKEIGEGKSIKWATADTLLELDRPKRHVKEDFRLDTPLEIVCNIDFERGELSDDISATEKHYDIECWDKKKANQPAGADLPADTDIYIQRNFENDYEKERFVVLEYTAGSQNFIMSEPIPVQTKDKFEIDVSMRLSADIPGSGSTLLLPVGVRLYADDGTYYTHQGVYPPSNDFPSWEATNSDFSTNVKFFGMRGDASEDWTQARGLYDGKSAEIPKDGFIRILLYQITNASFPADTIYDKLTFDFFMYINGSYKKYTLQYHKVTRTDPDQYIANREKTVKVSDSPHKLIKGSLFKESETLLLTSTMTTNTDHLDIPGNVSNTFYPGIQLRISGGLNDNRKIYVTKVDVIGFSTFVFFKETLIPQGSTSLSLYLLSYSLTEFYHNAARFPNGAPSSEFLQPYGEIQVFSVWNQYRNSNRIFTGTLRGIDSDLSDSGRINYPTLLHKYLLTDSNTNTNNKYFILLDFEINWKTCLWRGTFSEVYDTNTGKIYTDTHEFKYE